MPAACSRANRTSGRTITEQFHAFDAHNPHVYSALERMAARRLAAGATRISLKDLFEDLRQQLPYGVPGLNNNFTALYARKLIAAHPHCASASSYAAAVPTDSPPCPYCRPTIRRPPSLSARPLLLVVDPGDETYRGYCLEQVAAAYDVVLLTGTEPSWEKPYIVDHAVVDLHDDAALLAAGRALAARRKLAGVVTWQEWHLVPTARLARALGLPANSVEVMRACRNKATARTLFARHGVPSAATMKARTPPEAERATATIGFPAVIKPAASAGSIGVIRIDRPEELPAAFEFASAGASQSREDTGVLVEEYLDGPEVSVECVTHRGKTTAVAVTRKSLGPAPYFYETGHTVDATDPLLPQVAPVAAAAVKAVGITDGVQHVEMRLVDGRPRLIEVNARIGGDMIGHLVRLATGIDLPKAAADLACGRTPDLTPTRRQAAGIRMLYPAASGMLTDRQVNQPFAAHTPWLRQVQWMRQVGDPLLLPPAGDLFTARAGFYIVTGRDTGEVNERLEMAAEEIAVTTRAER